MCNRVKQFREEREKLNEIVLSKDNVNIKRFFGIDSAVYREGALDEKTKTASRTTPSVPKNWGQPIRNLTK